MQFLEELGILGRCRAGEVPRKFSERRIGPPAQHLAQAEYNAARDPTAVHAMEIARLVFRPSAYLQYLKRERMPAGLQERGVDCEISPVRRWHNTQQV